MAGKPVNCWCECHLVETWNLRWNCWGFLSFPNCNSCETAMKFLHCWRFFFSEETHLALMKWEDFRIGNLESFFSGVKKSCCIFFWKVWSSHHFFPTPPIRWVIFKTCQFSHEFLFEKPIGMTYLLDGNSWSIFSGIPSPRAVKNITQNHQRNTSEYWDYV